MPANATVLQAGFVSPSLGDSFLAPSIVADAYEYDHDRETIHVVALFGVRSSPWTLQFSLHRETDHDPLAEVTLQPAPSDVPKAEVLFAAATLAPGRYRVRAVLRDSADAEIEHAQWDFLRRSPSAPAQPNGPVEIPLLVEPYPDPVDASWAISTSVPLACGLVQDLNQLVLLKDGEPVGAQFSIQSRWSKLGSVCWVGLDFIARYRGGNPAHYVLRVSATSATAAPASNVGSEDDELIILRTATGRFAIHKQAFAGPVAELPAPDDPWPSVPYDGGPYLVDKDENVYETRNVVPDSLALVENGPIKATVAVSGWYATAPGPAPQKRLCRYVTHITAFVDSPLLKVSHRTILTFDPHVMRLADVGWRIPTRLRGPARFGIDGKVQPMAEQDDEGAFVHQDRHDRCWLLRTQGTQVLPRTDPMRRADGVVSVEGEGGEHRSATVFLRDVYQKFPKELGVTWKHDGVELSLHFWPRHGNRAFGPQEDDLHRELHRNNIYKLWYAHQGSLLDLKMPADYVSWLKNFTPDPNRNDENSIGDDAVDHARDGMAIGVAIANEFALMTGATIGDDQLPSLARAFQIDPHAIASPEWSSLTEVEGTWAASDPAHFPRAERTIENGMSALESAIAASAGEYGMWIYANVHDLWLPHLGDPLESGVPQLHRVWQASHYRNVWADWFLYLRSGSRALRIWARATSDHFLHIGTIHHVDGTIRNGKHVGDMYHCYATTPWGGQSDVWGHYIDPDAHRLRGLLNRDHYAFDMYRAWFSSLRANNPADFGHGRDAINTLGAVVSYYLHFQDANALLLLHRIAGTIFDFYWNTSLEQFQFGASPNPGDHPVWHRQCYMLYHRLTCDPRAVRFVVDLLNAGYGALSVASFAYGATGNEDYLSRFLPSFIDDALLYHDAPGDRYHGYGPAVAENYKSYFFQEAPYFLRALAQAGLQESAVGTRNSTYPSVHWGSFGTAVRAYALVPASVGSFLIRLVGERHRNQIDRGRCEVWRWSLNSNNQWEWRQDRWVEYSDYPSQNLTFDVNNGNVETLYRIDIASTESEFLAPFTDFPEVVEVRKEEVFAIHGWRRQSFWIDWKSDPQYPTAELGIAGERAIGHYHQPSFFRFGSSATSVESGQTVFAYSSRREVRQTLGNSRPVHFHASSVGGPVLYLRNGPPRIFLSLKHDHLDRLLPRVP